MPVSMPIVTVIKIQEQRRDSWAVHVFYLLTESRSLNDQRGAHTATYDGTGTRSESRDHHSMCFVWQWKMVILKTMVLIRSSNNQYAANHKKHNRPTRVCQSLQPKAGVGSTQYSSATLAAVLDALLCVPPYK